MTQRKYSISEIDRMRAALGTINMRWPPLYFSSEAERDLQPFYDAQKIEDQLRTYMQNGTEPEELEAEANNAGAKFKATLQKARDAVTAWEESHPIRRYNWDKGEWYT